LLSTTAVSYPIIEDTDPKFELQIVNAIMSKGELPWGKGTGAAVPYSYFPGLEIVVSVLSMVSRFHHVALLKYAGSFLGAITIVFFQRLYNRVSRRPSSHLLATSLAAMSPWFIPFDTYTIHPTLGFVFLAMLMLSLSERNKTWNVVKLLAMASMVVTHASGSYLVSFLLLVLAILRWRGKTSELPNLDVLTPMLLISMAGLWMGFVSSAYMHVGGLINFLSTLVQALSIPEFTAKELSPTGFKPLWVVVLVAIGMFAYGIVALGMFIRGLLRKGDQSRAENWLATAGLLMFALFLLPYLSGFSMDVDLLPRGLLYLYFLASPLVAGFVLALPRSVMVATKLDRYLIRKSAVSACLLLVMLIPAVYYGVPSGIYDPSLPMRHIDYRLNLNQWHVAGLFAADRISVHRVYGVRLAYDFVGGLGEKDVWRIELARDESLGSWFQKHRGQLVFLRLSIAVTQERNLFISESDLLSVISHANVLYSSDEVILVMVP